MKAFATIDLGPLGSVSFHHAIEATPRDLPHGVTAENWLRLDENLGLVIEPTQAQGAFTGRFMVKRSGIWHRLSIRTE